MSLYDNLMESVIYEDSVEEYKERIEILKEFHYSKEELQDPETVEKIYKEFEEQSKHPKNIYNILAIGFGIISIILAIPTFTMSLFIIAPICLKLFKLAENLPLKEKEKNINKLSDNCNKTIAKLKKELSTTKDNEEKKKIQKEIDNINNVLSKIIQEENKLKDKLNKERIKKAIEAFEDAIKFYKYPYIGFYAPQHGDTYSLQSFYIVNKCKCDMNAVIDKMKKNSETLERDDWSEPIFKLNKNKDTVYNICFNDWNAKYLLYLKEIDTFVIFSKDIESKGKNNFALSYLSSEAQKYTSKEDIELYIEADKELGYYLLSKAPEGITPKPNPFK